MKVSPVTPTGQRLKEMLARRRELKDKARDLEIEAQSVEDDLKQELIKMGDLNMLKINYGALVKMIRYGAI